METLSLDGAMALTGLSRSTLWRRIRTRDVAHETIGAAKGHTRTRVALDDTLALCGLTLDAEERALVLSADAGEAEAQSDLGLLLLEAGRPERALPWLELAAAQGYADAMLWLGKCYAEGTGAERDEAQAILWLRKAAEHGSRVAQLQIDALRR